MFISKFFDYNTLKAEAASRYPTAIEKLTNNPETEIPLSGKDLDPALSTAEKSRWAWENVLQRVELELLTEAAKIDGLDFSTDSGITRHLLETHARLKLLEKWP